MPTPDLYVLIIAVEKPKQGEWCELAEFIVDTEEKVDEIFNNMVAEEEYPLVLKAKVCQKAEKDV